MRFGISATSLIEPKNFRTRLRPVNVCAIVSLSILYYGGKRGRLSERPHSIATIRTGVGAARFYVIRVEPEPPHSSHLASRRLTRPDASRDQWYFSTVSCPKAGEASPVPSLKSTSGPSRALASLGPDGPAFGRKPRAQSARGFR